MEPRPRLTCIEAEAQLGPKSNPAYRAYMRHMMDMQSARVLPETNTQRKPLIEFYCNALVTRLAALDRLHGVKLEEHDVWLAGWVRWIETEVGMSRSRLDDLTWRIQDEVLVGRRAYLEIPAQVTDAIEDELLLEFPDGHICYPKLLELRRERREAAFAKSQENGVAAQPSESEGLPVAAVVEEVGREGGLGRKDTAKRLRLPLSTFESKLRRNKPSDPITWLNDPAAMMRDGRFRISWIEKVEKERARLKGVAEATTSAAEAEIVKSIAAASKAKDAVHRRKSA